MRRAPDDARGSDGARGGVDLIHASLSSAEKVDIARARRTRARYLRPSGSRLLRVRGQNNFRGHFFRPGHPCFGLRDRGGQGSFSAAQRRRPGGKLGGAKGEYSLKKRSLGILYIFS